MSDESSLGERIREDLAARFTLVIDRATWGMPQWEQGVALAGSSWTCIEAAHTEPHRKYHTLLHLYECLHVHDAMKLLRVGFREHEERAIELAIFFHDLVYDTHADDNESRSADLLVFHAERLHVPPIVTELARAMVLATHTHTAPSGAPEALKHFLDVDLQILGAKEERYDRYAREIREEYAWVPEDDYRDRRRLILKGLENREWLYLTEPFRRHSEGAARDNIRRELRSFRRPR